MIPPYPLHWPDMLPRTERRESSRMRTSLAAALENVRDSLRLFGDDTGKPVADASLSSNVGGLSLSEQKLKDPGVAVWFQWDGAPRCIAVDRYLTPAENLQAIHHIIEARRTEMRHGGLHIVRQTFKGFTALPSPAGQKPPQAWWAILGVKHDATPEQIEAAWREKAKKAHPDAGGSDEEMARLNRARDEGRRANG